MACCRCLPCVHHQWCFWGKRIRHIARIGRFVITRVYALENVRAFFCSGPHACGPVAFHDGRYVVQVASLPVPADNQWLMRRLNERLEATKRKLLSGAVP